MTDRLTIALAQLNPVMGDIPGNLAKARAARAEAASAGADLILFTELFITGYPPEDLVLKPALQEDAREAIEKLARDTADGGPAVLIGTPWVEAGQALQCLCLSRRRARCAASRCKVDLPNYGVFDEKRVFAAGPMPGPFSIRGVRIGVPICEDIWTPDVVECLSETGAEILLVPNGSPFEVGKEDVRLNHIVSARDRNRFAACLSQSGGRAGRDRVRRRLHGDERRSHHRRVAALLGGKARRSRNGSAKASIGFARRANAHAPKTARHPSITRWCWACAIM